jgi:hypothetical protein
MGVEGLLALVEPPTTLAGSEWDAGEMVASVARLLAPAARQRGVALETQVPSPLPASGERGNALATLLRLALQGLAGLPDHARLVLEAEVDRVGGGVAFRVRLEAPGAEPSALAEWCRDAGAIERLGAQLEAAPSDPRRVVLTLRVPPGEGIRPAGQAAGGRGRASP